jgi:hypothetical protein
VLTAAMLLSQIRTAEEWSPLNVLGVVLLAIVVVAALVIVVRVIWRR